MTARRGRGTEAAWDGVGRISLYSLTASGCAAGVDAPHARPVDNYLVEDDDLLAYLDGMTIGGGSGSAIGSCISATSIARSDGASASLAIVTAQLHPAPSPPRQLRVPLPRACDPPWRRLEQQLHSRPVAATRETNNISARAPCVTCDIILHGKPRPPEIGPGVERGVLYACAYTSRQTTVLRSVHVSLPCHVVCQRRGGGALRGVKKLPHDE